MKYITFPVEDEKVELLQTVGGVVFDNKKLQVYVLANDGRYYLQDPIMYDGIKWTCGCGFGDSNTQSGATFYVLVVESEERPHSPIDTMKYPVLDYVNVERATPAG